MKAALATIALALLLAPRARAEDAKLPFAPFEKAAKGDWAVLRGTFDAGATAEHREVAVYARVVAATPDSVTVSEFTDMGAIEKTTRRFARGETRVAVLLDVASLVSSATLEAEKRGACGKALACTDASFAWSDGRAIHEAAASFAEGVKAGGLVALRIETRVAGATESVLALEVAGWGSGSDADAGETPEKLLRDAMLVLPEEDVLLPLDPFARAKAGEWTAYSLEIEEGAKTRHCALGLVVKTVQDGEVALEESIHERGRVHRVPLSFSRKKPVRADTLVAAVLSEIVGRSRAVVRFKLANDTWHARTRLDCRRATFTALTDVGRAKVKLWVTDDLGSIGLAAIELVLRSDSRKIDVSLELQGYGSDANTTEWGKTAEELAARHGER